MNMEVHGQQQTDQQQHQQQQQQRRQRRQSAEMLTTPLSIENTKQVTQDAVYLSTAALRLHRRGVWQGQPRQAVPPVTPNSEFQFEHTFQSLPQTFSDLLQDLEIPIVKNKGVKRCIEELGQYLRCTDYEINVLHFWILDVITDCIRRTQNRFHLPPREQSIVLGWVLFFIDIIRDISKNLSRNEFIKICQETILGAAKVLQEGNDILFPLKLVHILGSEVPDTESSDITLESSKTSSSIFGKFSDTINSGEENLENEMNQECPVNEEMNPRPPTSDSCTCSALDITEQSVYEGWNENIEEMTEYDFLHHNVNLSGNKMKPRFLSLSSIQELHNEVDIENIFLKDIEEISQLKFLQIGKMNHRPGSDQSYIIFRKNFLKTLEKEMISDKDQKHPNYKLQDETVDASKTEDDIGDTNTQRGMKIQDLRKYQLLEQRINSISDTDIFSDWQMEDVWRTIKDNNGEGEEEDKCLGVASFEESSEYDEKEYISFKVLWAIIDFISE